MPPPTRRLWLTEPARKTGLLTVTATRGGAFTLDRSLFCPKSRAYRHPQLPDRGVVWTPDGEKRKLVRVDERDGVLWHRLKGAVPVKGDTLQAHLDQDRRRLVSRAHTALHLLLSVLPKDGSVALAADPQVQGGGTARVTFREAWVDRHVLKGWLDAVNAHVAADRRVWREPVTRDAAAHKLVPQPFAEGDRFPGPEATLEAVHVDGVGGLPCDGTHVDRTGEVGRVMFPHAHTGQDGGFVLVLKVS